MVFRLVCWFDVNFNCDCGVCVGYCWWYVDSNSVVFEVFLVGIDEFELVFLCMIFVVDGNLICFLEGCCVCYGGVGVIDFVLGFVLCVDGV